nr:mRNA-decapping enzyme subunit 2 [Tanacetum cinerariifolium]
DAGDCAVCGFGFGAGNWIGNGILDILAFNLNFCKARATMTCSCSSRIPFCKDELSVCWVTEKRKSRSATENETHVPSKPSTENKFKFITTSTTPEIRTTRPHKFPAVGAAPYIPVGHFRAHHGIAPPVTIRNAIPVFSAPPLPMPHMGIVQPNQLPPQFRGLPTMCGVAPPVTMRQAMPVYSAPNIPQSSVKSVPSSIPPTDDKGHTISTVQDSKSPVKPSATSVSTMGGFVENFESKSKKMSSSKHGVHHPPKELIDDLCSRFVLNVPKEDQQSFERILFLVEYAHWFYEDNSVENNPSLKSFTLKEFTSLMFNSCDVLKPYVPHIDDIFKDFTSYKVRVPVTGAIILDQTYER